MIKITVKTKIKTYLNRVIESFLWLLLLRFLITSGKRWHLDSDNVQHNIDQWNISDTGCLLKGPLISNVGIVRIWIFYKFKFSRHLNLGLYVCPEIYNSYVRTSVEHSWHLSCVRIKCRFTYCVKVEQMFYCMVLSMAMEGDINGGRSWCVDKTCI